MSGSSSQTGAMPRGIPAQPGPPHASQQIVLSSQRLGASSAHD
jgi:hypothetical protein